MSDEAAITFTLDEKAGVLRAIMKRGDAVLGERHLNADAVDRLIADLAAARSHMKPSPPMDIPAGPHTATIDPRWWTQLDAATGMIVLALRHTGFGWMSFLLPPASIQQLHALFSRQIDALTPPPGKPN